MTLKEAYESVESNYDNVLKRLGSEGMIKRFAVKFIDELYEVSAALTEQLRGYEITGSEAVYQQVVEQYDRLIAAIKAID